MPLRSASDYSTNSAYNLAIAELGKQPVDRLEQRLAEVSNSLSGSSSTINNTSRALAAELAPVLKEALKHEKAARTQIVTVSDVFNTNLPKLRELVGQLNQGRLHRDGFKDGKELSKKAQRLHKQVFDASDTLLTTKVTGNKHAEDALAHAESLANQLEERLN